MTLYLYININMICEICNKSFGRQGGHFNKHLFNEHNINNYESYILKIKYNDLKPKCACGCGDNTIFYFKDYKKYCHGHNTKHLYELNKDLLIDNIITEEYKKGMLVKDISLKYNVSLNIIYKILNDNKVIKTISKSKQKYKINEEIFKEIDTEEKAYWLGFLFADGYNNTNKNSVALTLSNVDLDHLYKFKNFVETNKPIRRNNDNSSKLVLENKLISSDLNNHGVIQNKTHKLEFPNIESKLENHFIRGYFDGDGCITYGKIIGKYANISIVSNKIFLEKIVDKININFTYTKRHKKKADNIFTIGTGGIINLIIFYHYIYNDATIYMDRKRNKFIEWFDYYFKNVKIKNKTKKILKEINYGKY
jgi:hypothetical protein